MTHTTKHIFSFVAASLLILLALFVVVPQKTTAAAPDLTVASGLALPNTITVGDTLTFTANIKNIGDAPTGDSFIIRFRVDGGIIKDVNSDSLASGNTRTKEALWTATAGTHTVRVCADAPVPGVIAETKESNNCLEKAFTVTTAPLPDLTVSTIAISPDSILDGDAVTFTADITNSGEAATGDSFIIRFRIDGSIIKDVNSDSLAAGNTRTKEATWTATPGDHTVRVCADAPIPGVIAESKEANNCLEKNFLVTTTDKEGPDLTITRFVMNPQSLVAGDGVTFTADTTNAGDAPTGDSFIIRFRVDGGIIKDVNSDSLASGNTRTKEALWTATAGTHTVRVCADAPVPGVIAETKESNNCQELNVTVESNGGGDGDGDGFVLPACPLSAGANEYIVPFENNLGLVAHKSLAEATVGPFGTSIPKGSYKVTLVSYDDHSNKPDQTQTHEQYYLKLANGSGGLVAQTAPTPDLADNKDIATFVVNNTLTLGQAIASVTAQHHAYPSSNPESIAPVCAKFTRLLEPEPDKAMLTLTKIVVNDNGGTAKPNDFNLEANTVPLGDPIAVDSGVPVELTPGDYVVSEDNLPGYTAGTWGGDCEPLGDTSGTITLHAGENKTCTITNDDIEQPQPEKANVFIEKSVTPTEQSLHGTTTPFVYTLHYGNNGAKQAQSVTISDTPSPLTILNNYQITDGPDQGSCEVLDGGITCVLGTLAAGAEGTIVYEAYIAGNVGGTVHNTAIISTATDESTLDDNTDEADVSVSVPDIVDVSVEKLVDGDSSSSGTIGTKFVYTLSYANEGAQTAVNVILTDGLETDGIVEITEITKQADHTKPMNPEPCDIVNNGQGIECLLGDLEIGDSGTVTYEAKALASGTVHNFAHISATNEDPDALGNNDADARVTVTTNAPEADVAITKTVDPTSQRFNQTFTYTLTYENLGNIAAEEVTIDDTPDKPNFLGSWSIIDDPEHGDCHVKSSGEGIACTLGTLEPGDSGTIKYTVVGLQDGSVENIATITTVTGESDFSNNEDRANIEMTSGGGGGGGCSNCGGGGGGRSNPNVLLFSNAPEVAGASISLASVPYTGVGDVVQIVLYFVGLLALAGIITYGLFRYYARRRQHAGHLERATQKASESITVQPTSRVVTPPVASTRPQPKPEPTMQIPNHDRQSHDAVLSDELSQALDAAAQGMHALVSADGKRIIATHAQGKKNEAVRTLERVVREAEKQFAREDGWLLLNQERVADILFASRLSTVPLFVQWLVTGNQTQIFSFLRSLTQQGRSPEDFVRRVVAALDAVYQDRLAGVEEDVDPTIAELVASLSREELEAMITTLTRGIDGGYRSTIDGIKVAVTRILSTHTSTQTTEKELPATTTKAPENIPFADQSDR